MPDDKIIVEGRIFAVLSYLFILSLVAVAFGRSKEFSAFHIKQGLLLFILEVAAIALGAVPKIGVYLFAATWLVLAGLSIIGTANAWSGKYWSLPFPLGRWAAEIQL
jgi:uncharacterized membrane protein